MSAEPKPLPFEILPGVFCDYCPVALRVAMNVLGPSHLYSLSVHPREFLSASNRIREWTNAPLAYQINVHADPDLEGFAWYLSANGRDAGSRGA